MSFDLEAVKNPTRLRVAPVQYQVNQTLILVNGFTSPCSTIAETRFLSVKDHRRSVV